jgi:hypothetical protein
MQPDLFREESRETVQVRCISLWQPWASLMVCGAKFVETRDWDTSVRGVIYIHAAKTIDGLKDCKALARIRPDFIVAMEEALALPFDAWSRRLPFQQLIGRGELHATVSTPVALDRFPSQEPFGDFSWGRFGHLYRDLETIAPIPMGGRQGFFFTNLPSHLVNP